MSARKVYISIYMLLIIFVMSRETQAQSDVAPDLVAMEKRVDSLEGYEKLKLCLEIAENCQTVSLTKSLSYCQKAMTIFSNISSEDSYRPDIDKYDEPDSVLELRAKMYYLMGKSYFMLDDDVGEDTLIVLSESSRANKLNAISNFNSMLNIYLYLNDETGTARAHNCLGVVLMTMNKLDSALTIYQKNLDIFQRSDNKTGLSMTYNNIACIYSRIPNHKNLVARNLRTAIMYAREANVYSVEASATCNLAADFMDSKNYKMALKYFNELLPKCIEHRDYLTMKTIYSNLAKIYSKTNKYKDAYENLKKCIQVKDSLRDEETMHQLNELAVKYETAKHDIQISELNKQKEIQQVIMEEGAKLVKRQKQWLFFISLFLVIAIVASLFAFLENHKKHNANSLLLKANDNINESIKYASRLQKIIITGERKADELLNDFFVFHRPKNIVSGDFYYVRDFGRYRVVAVADCTGHGVPAAFLSVLNITFFNELFTTMKGVPNPASVLESVRAMAIKALNQTSDLSSSTDGMDCGLVIVDKETHHVQYSGGYIDLYVLKNETGKIEVIRSTHNPVCWYVKMSPFKNEELRLDPNDVIYLFTDGYPDQINFSKKEKYSKYRLRTALEQMAFCELETQKMMLGDNLAVWQGNSDQIDDILVVGIRVRSLFE